MYLKSWTEVEAKMMENPEFRKACEDSEAEFNRLNAAVLRQIKRAEIRAALPRKHAQKTVARTRTLSRSSVA